MEFSNGDSLLFYFDRTGGVVHKSIASYFRKGRIDSTYINVEGKFKDFYIKGSIALEAVMRNNSLDGFATYFYDDGNVLSKGNYIRDVKDGIWTYYYRNGQIEKVIDFQKGTPVVLEYYTKRGKQMVVKGNGKYKGSFNRFESDYFYKIEGELSEGRMHGEWTWFGSSKVGVEYFNKGLFVKGVSLGREYSDAQNINLVGYYPSEIVNFYDNYFGYPIKDGRNVRLTTRVDFPKSYLDVVSDSLNNSLIRGQKDQWVFIKIKIKRKNDRNDIIIKSSINDTIIEEKIYSILKSIEDVYSIVYIPSKENKLESDWFIKKDTNYDYIYTILLKDHVFIIPVVYLADQRKNLVK